MLLKIIRYIKGYIRIRITGYSTERFLNACSHKGIVLWGLTPVNRAYEMNIQVKGFRQLKPIIRKTGTKGVIVGRFGLPFFYINTVNGNYFLQGLSFPWLWYFSCPGISGTLTFGAILPTRTRLSYVSLQAPRLRTGCLCPRWTAQGL